MKASRLLPRWAEAGFIVAGLGGAGAGAGLLLLDGRCPGGGDASVFESCPQVYGTRNAGFSALAVGAGALIVGVVTLAVDEHRQRHRRLAHRPGLQALALRPATMVSERSVP